MIRHCDAAVRPAGKRCSGAIAGAALRLAGLALLIFCWGGPPAWAADASRSKPPAGSASFARPPLPPGPGAATPGVTVPDRGRVPGGDPGAGGSQDLPVMPGPLLEPALPGLAQPALPGALPNLGEDVGRDSGRLVILLPLQVGPGIAPAIAADYGLQVIQLVSLASLNQELLLAAPPAGLSALEAVSLIELDPRVSLVQLDLPYALQRGPEGSTLAVTPQAPQQAAIERAAGAGVLIGLIDSAVDSGHPALAGADIELADLVGTAQTAAEAAHGTAMAGAILGGEQAGGVARGARLLAIRAFGDENGGGGLARSRSFKVARAIDLALLRQVALLNLSFAGPPDPLVARLLARAAELGVLAIGAAGNAGPEAPPAYPAALSGVLAVTAIDGQDRLYAQANRGAYVGLSALAVDVLVAGPGGGYEIASGTSIAAARVTGLAAVLLAEARGGSGLGTSGLGAGGTLRASALDGLLRRTAVDLGPRGADESFGAGKVDGPAARAAARSLSDG